MTALEQYSRLECPGIWRSDPDAQRLDVIVSFGDASVVIADRNGSALSHWSLAAVVRVNRGEVPAIYTPSAEASELLEIDDSTMIDAIERVRAALLKTRPRRGRLRLVLFGVFLAALVAGAALWLPGALQRHTLGVVPDPTRTQIGTQLFTAIGRISGSPCRTPRGDAALAQLHARLLPAGRGGLLVLPEGIPPTLSLPGGLMLLNRELVEEHDSADVVAGYILAEAERRDRTDPLGAVLDSAGIIATLRLLTTGEIRARTLQAYAESLAGKAPEPVPEAALLARFASAGVPSTPYAYALDVTGETTLSLIEADPKRGGEAREPVLKDSDWVALQGICGN